MLEDDDQRGLAHFVEHMSFNGTLHFPQQTVAGFMQSLGMRFGAHVNAHTSFDETVYELQVPTDNPAVIDRSLLILEDWAHNVSFDPAEIDKERGVILEEWRLGLGADERIQNTQFPLLLNGSRYAERLPIGKPEIIQNVNHDRLKQFYADWYRPDLMAVIAVGDFDKAAIEAQIKSHFGSIPAASSPKPRPAYTVPDQPGTRYSVITDPEATVTHIGVYGKMAARDQTTIGGYRQQMVERLFSGMLSARLDEIAQTSRMRRFSRPAPTAGSSSARRKRRRSRPLVAEGGVERGLAALFTEIDRVARFGFTATELNRQRLNLQRVSREGGHREGQEPVGAAGRRVRAQLHSGRTDSRHRQRVRPESAFPAADHAGRGQQSGQGLAARSQSSRRGQRAGKGSAGACPARRSWRPSSRRRAARRSRPTSTPSARSRCSPSCRHREPSPRRPTNEALGITEWQLSNGVRVVLKPTTFKQDEILFRAVSPGGTSLASDEDFVSGRDRERGRRAGRSWQSPKHRSEQDARRHQRGRAGRDR